MTLFFTSDTHFSDRRVLVIDRRPFKTLEEHDAALIANWNAVVNQRDEVWHLGDFAKGSRAHVEDLLDQLHGTKHLIVGNNDPETTTGARGWSSVQHYAELHVEGWHLILCHYAFRTWNQIGKGSINLHGHSHGKLKKQTRQYDVGVDAHDYRPVTLEQILPARIKRPKSKTAR